MEKKNHKKNYSSNSSKAEEKSTNQFDYDHEQGIFIYLVYRNKKL